MTMFDHDDPSILWVSGDSDGAGEGTHDAPFCSIENALSITKPGTTIVLKNGEYSRDVTFDISGTIHNPIRIIAETDGAVVIRGACWFFYDVCDLIVSGFTFKDSPHGALSVMGACHRNRFADLRFINCGISGSASCTLFFGGAGGNCNLVENCLFERLSPPCSTQAADCATIALMVGEGDPDNGAPLIDHIVRKNRIVNYDYGILIGSGDGDAGLCGHIVEYNTVEGSGFEGILVKCGDTVVRGNLVIGSRKNSIGIGAGNGSVIQDNRILDCGSGISINGSDHTVANNCIVRCGNHAIHACGVSDIPPRRAATNLIVGENTCIDCGTGAETNSSVVSDVERIAGVRLDVGVTGVIERNLFAGPGRPYEGKNLSADILVADNLASHSCEAMEGVVAKESMFACFDGDDFSNESGYGACGWMVMPEGFNPRLDASEEADGYAESPLDDVSDDETLPEEAEEEPAEEPIEDFNDFMGRLYNPNLEDDIPQERA